jgi:hypothetical protein
MQVDQMLGPASLSFIIGTRLWPLARAGLVIEVESSFTASADRRPVIAEWARDHTSPPFVLGAHGRGRWREGWLDRSNAIARHKAGNSHEMRMTAHECVSLAIRPNGHEELRRGETKPRLHLGDLGAGSPAPVRRRAVEFNDGAVFLADQGDVAIATMWLRCTGRTGRVKLGFGLGIDHGHIRSRVPSCRTLL